MHEPSRITHKRNSAGSIDLVGEGVGSEQGACGQASEHRGEWRLDGSIVGPRLEPVSAAVVLLCGLSVLWENTNTRKSNSVLPFCLSARTSHCA